MDKRCNKCGEIKDVSFFGKESRAKNGFKPRCKKCTTEYQRQFYSENRETFKNYTKRYYENNKDSVIAKVKSYSSTPKAKARKKEYMVGYYDKNRSRINALANENEKRKYRNCPRYAFIRNVRKSVYRIKNNNKRTEDLLGYSFQDLIDKLGRFPETFENIDHKIPVSWFKTGTCPSIINHLENLHIISKTENVRKHNKYSHPVSDSYFQTVKDHLIPKRLNEIQK